MTTLRQAAEQMLQSVNQMLLSGEWYCAQERADALRAALAQAAAQPVAWWHESVDDDGVGHFIPVAKRLSKHDVPLYAHPAPAQVEPQPDKARTLTAMVDAAMVEMKNIVPPLRRSECERLIHAAISTAQQPLAERKPLTDADILRFARAIEAQHGITGEQQP
jgi:hypothetical protein